MIKVVYGMLVSDDDDRKVNDIVRWCNDHPLKKKDVYENNAYGLKHKCEKDLLCLIMTSRCVKMSVSSLEHCLKKKKSS